MFPTILSAINLFLATLISIYFVLGESIQINYVRVPQAVQNNTNASIIIDCNYSLRPDDTGLVVKWTLNNDLVYQWIPHTSSPPVSVGLLKDRLDLSFKVSNDKNMAYRAMKIINPTTELAGEYKCLVSTFADEDFSYKFMTVFEPETEMHILRGLSNAINANFTCVVYDVYPEPKLLMFMDKRDENSNKIILNEVEVVSEKKKSRRYDVYLTVMAATSTLYAGELIHCEMKIPKTGYVRRKSILYYPKIIQEWNGAMSILRPSYYLFCSLVCCVTYV